MLFILHNNVVLSFFLRAFYTVFCILYTYFLHISYTFYIYFSHFIHFSCYFSSNIARLWPNINALSCVFNTLSCVFPSISYNFLYICTNIARIFAHSHSFALCQLLHFLYICTNFFYTLHENCIREAHSFAQTFSSLPPYFFQLVRNFVTICFQLPCKTSQLSTAFSYVIAAFSFHFVSVSTAFSIRNVSISTTFLAHIVYATTMFLTCNVYATTMFLTHNIYLSITKYL